MKVEIFEGFENLEITIKCSEATENIRKLETLIYSYGAELTCTKNGVKYLISVNDVLYFESVDKRTFLYTEIDVYELQLKLYEVEEMLGSAGFIRSAKSQIINTYKIESLRPDFGGRIETTMAGGEKLIVSRQYASSLKEKLNLK